MPASPLPTALELAQDIRAGRRTAADITAEALARIETTDGEVGAFLYKTPDLAMATAETVDRDLAAGKPLHPLAGVPIALKDNLNLVGTPTTCASQILKGYISPYDATVVARLKAAGLPMVGKTNLDEFAMGSSTENSALQVTRNPWDLERVPGGSSGGSAACVAAGHVPLSLGSDTGGSVRQPAALCGLVGVKPTYGMVSRFGLVAFASSLDQISPFARTVADAAALLEAIAGFDPHDSTSLTLPEGFDLTAGLANGINGLRVGIITELDGTGMQPEVAESLQQAAETLQSLGATVTRVSLPSIKAAVPAYYILATAEASSNLARFDGVRYGHRDEPPGALPKDYSVHTMYRRTRGEGFGPEVRRRIMLGTFCLSSGYYDAYYGKAQRVQAVFRHEFAEAFRNVDVLMCPTSPTTAFKIGEKADDPVSMYLSDIATIPANLVGIPALSIPCGFDGAGLPIGLQLLGPRLSEPTLFRTAHAFEQATGLGNLLPERYQAPVSASVAG